MNLARERLLCIEVCKTWNSLNPCFMQELFKLRKTNRSVCNKYKLNLNIPVVNQINYGTRSLRSFGPEIWKSLPHHVKSAENLKTFKKIINNWNGVSCNCLVCGLEKLHKNLLGVYYISAFLIIVIFTYIFIHISPLV